MRKIFGLGCKSKNYLYLCTANHPKKVLAEAQMAESVDALVSNTSRFTPVPVRPRLWVRKEEDESLPLFVYPSPGAVSRWRCGRVVFGRRLLLSQSFVFDR